MKKLLIIISLFFAYSAFAQTFFVQNTKFDNNATLSINKSYSDSIYYDYENFDNSFGTNNVSSNFGCFILIPEDSLKAKIGKQLSAIKFYIYDKTKITKLNVRIYNDSTKAPILDKTYTPNDKWNIVDFESLPLPSEGYLLVGYYIETIGGFPVGIDDGPLSSNGNIFYYKEKWKRLTDVSIFSNLHIRALLDTKSSKHIYNIEKINILPNPAMEFISISIPDVAFLNIYDIYGNKVYSKEVSNNENIYVYNLVSGFYIASFEIDGKIFNTKFVKE